MDSTAVADLSSVQVHRVRFTGLATEYFRVWIVSLCLSILTLGIYSAWGKVRKKRYLYAHTLFDGSAFAFTGRPVAILRGRVIAVALFGGLAMAGHFFPLLQIAFALLLLLVTPWIVVAGNRFNSHNSKYRNIRFGFDGRVGEAAKIFVGIGLLLIPTIGLIYPYYRLRRLRFVMNHQRYGATPFTTEFLGGDFYAAYVIGALILVAWGLVAVFGGAMLTDIVGKPRAGSPLPALAIVPIVFGYGGYLVAFSYVRARIGNLTFDGTRIGVVQLSSTLRVRDLCWLYLSNVIAIVCTVGLATPWAIIRMSRYRAARLSATTTAPLATLASASTLDATATGSEVSDLFDVDISI